MPSYRSQLWYDEVTELRLRFVEYPMIPIRTIPIMPSASSWSLLLLGLVTSAFTPNASARDLGLTTSGDIAIEGRVFPHSPQFEGQFDGLQASVILEPEWRRRQGPNRYSLIPFLRLDDRDDERTHFDLREAYWLHVSEEWELLVGANKVFWGVTESRHLVDIVNQTDLVEDIDEEDKLGQPMIQLATQRDWGRVGLFLMPYFRERTYPGRAGRLRFALPVDTDAAVFEADAEQWHPDLALRYAHSFGDWDLGGYWFYGTGREPRLLVNTDATRLVPHYDLIHQVGTDIQFTRDAWLWKLEAIVREGQGETFGALVGGFEYSLYQIMNSAADLGLLFEYLYDGREQDPERAPVTLFDDDVFVGLRLALNDVQGTEILGGGILDIRDGSKLWFLEMERRLGDRWKLELEGRFFTDIDPENPLNGFKNDDYITLRVSYGF